jgi:hypothetical protein
MRLPFPAVPDPDLAGDVAVWDVLRTAAAEITPMW